MSDSVLVAKGLYYNKDNMMCKFHDVYWDKLDWTYLHFRVSYSAVVTLKDVDIIKNIIKILIL